MNKFFLITIIVILAVVLAAGFFGFKYLNQIKQVETQNSLGGANIENPAEQKTNIGAENQNSQTQTPQVQIQAGGIQTEENSGGGSLSVCLDKCGDGICQKTDSECAKTNSNLNCVCAETPQDCPQDCK